MTDFYSRRGGPGSGSCFLDNPRGNGGVEDEGLDGDELRVQIKVCVGEGLVRLLVFGFFYFSCSCFFYWLDLNNHTNM